MNGLRLNLCCGGTAPGAWINADLVAAEAGQIVLDIRDPWPWPDGAADGIVIHHALEMLAPGETWQVLRKCYRTLAPGGCVRISCADLIVGVDRAIARDEDWFVEPRANFEETVGYFVTQGAGGRKQFLTMARLADALRDAGFEHVFPSRFRYTKGPEWMTQLDSREQESLFCEAIK